MTKTHPPEQERVRNQGNMRRRAVAVRQHMGLKSMSTRELLVEADTLLNNPCFCQLFIEVVT